MSQAKSEAQHALRLLEGRQPALPVFIDYEESRNLVGGTALLGISQPVVKAHGSSNAYAFYNAIRQAKTVAEADIVGDIAANVEHMRWERPKPAEKQEEG